jgi:hypothetical protein
MIEKNHHWEYLIYWEAELYLFRSLSGNLVFSSSEQFLP